MTTVYTVRDERGQAWPVFDAERAERDIDIIDGGI